jgi:hypothetical protein
VVRKLSRTLTIRIICQKKKSTSQVANGGKSGEDAFALVDYPHNLSQQPAGVKEAYYSGKRDLLQWQKRPTIAAKLTYYTCRNSPRASARKCFTWALASIWWNCSTSSIADISCCIFRPAIVASAGSSDETC